MRPAEVAAQCVLKDTYTLGKVLGSGSFATVYSCSSDPSVVIKRVDRAPTGSKGDRQVPSGAARGCRSSRDCLFSIKASQ